VEFFVLGRDHAGFADDDPELDEAHWAYLDDYADRLIARGPTLSDAGEHTGSVHIVRLADHATAIAFAHDEPYWRANLYESLEVVPFRNLLGVTMWQRERLPDVDRSWLSLLRWPAACEFREAGLDAATRDIRADRSIVFCGLLLDASMTRATCLVAGFDASRPVPPAVVIGVAEGMGGARSEATVERWQRGGRDQ
jgi:uncharacterized protein YciI